MHFSRESSVLSSVRDEGTGAHNPKPGKSMDGSVETWVLTRQLKRQAQERPDQTWVQFLTGSALTYSEADAQAHQVATGLKRLGVGFGDRVAVWLPNNRSHLLTWLGCSYRGAVHVAVNLEYQGSFLRHVLADSQAKVLVMPPEFLDKLNEISDTLPHMEWVVLTEPTAPETAPRAGPPDLKKPWQAFSTLMAGPPDGEVAAVTYRDLASILYTSGTTGPSKGVLMPHAHTYLFGLGTIENLRLQEDDCYYVCLPLFHANALFMQVYAVLIRGATAVIRERFSASAWLSDVRQHQCTVSNALGVMVEFILRQPPSKDDQDHVLRVLTSAPLPAEQVEPFRQRFGVPYVVELYGMTEVNIPLYSPLDAPRPGSCGKPWDAYFDVTILHPETDEPVPAGEIGEICVRPKQPYGFMAGYHALSDKTVEAWRNFWFHTGDAGQCDAEGYFYFRDRIKDCIRRRGENISSYELESVLLEHPAVAEVAAIAVPDSVRGGEDEIKLVLVPQPGGPPSADAIWAYCEQHLPRFMQPRFLEWVEALPKTPTSKVQKAKLREIGVSPQTVVRS